MMDMLLSTPRALRIRLLPVLPQQDLGRVNAAAAALAMLSSIADGETAPAVSLCFSGVFLQRAGLICCLLPGSSTCLAPSFPDTPGMLMALGFPTS